MRFDRLRTTSRLTASWLTAALCAAVTLLSAPATGGVVSLKEVRGAGVVLQKWDKSCGAAALATVMTYHFGDPVSEREVASGLMRQTEPLKVRHRGGFSLLDMKRYAEERGYRAYGFTDLGFEDIRHLDAPIVPVQFINGYDHYVVFKGLRANGDVWVADPAFGNYTMSRDRFERMWKGNMAFVLLKGE